MATVTLEQVTVPLRAFQLCLSLTVDSTVALIGPSGAGKSTVLNAIAGLVKPAAGSIRCDEETWFDADRGVFVRPEDRRVGLVFQDYALFPHLTVRQNIEYARRHGADEYLDRFGIRQLERARPGSLSGGERQRVALARALARDPEILLLDEPLSALDAHTKIEVRTELQELLAELEIPTLLVTHDFEDAAALAGHVGVIVDGELRQKGSPADLVAEPADAFVASFTGANLLHGQPHRASSDTTGIRLDDGRVILTSDSASAPGRWPCTLGHHDLDEPPRRLRDERDRRSHHGDHRARKPGARHGRARQRRDHARLAAQAPAPDGRARIRQLQGDRNPDRRGSS